MVKGLNLAAIAIAIALLPATGLADCFRANGDDGRLAFTASAEGSEFTGSFSEFSVSLCMEGQDLTTAAIEVTVATASADTGDNMRDSELKGENFFHVHEYPEATWESSEVRRQGDGFVAEGKLTLRGIEKSQTVRLQLSDSEPPEHTGSADIMRLQWDVGIGEDFDDTDFIRNRVDLSFEIQLRPAS